MERDCERELKSRQDKRRGIHRSLLCKSDYRTMNTNSNKVGGPETKETFAVIKRIEALHSIKMGLATAVLFASVGMATAQAGANQYHGLHHPAQHTPTFSRSAHIRYDHSGTGGRKGLGAIRRCSISRREAGRPGEGACYYEYRRNGVLD
jgi:hypothetical protein